MSNELANYEVAIIGLGPVGAAFANILGQFGIKTVILEREAGTYNLPRAVMFDDEIMRLFQTLGLAEKVLKVSEVGGGARFIDANDNTLVHWSRSEALSPNNWYSNYRFHQPDLENVLREGYRRYPHVTEMWNCDVIDLHQTDDDVTVIYHKGSNNSNKSLRANYVVGCDGARSFTRDNINPDILDLGFHEPWLVIDLLMNNPEKIESRESLHFCQPNCSGTYVFLGSKRKRWEFRINQSDEVEDICRPEFIWSLLKQWISPEEAELERATVYTFHSMIAKQWRQGRLFIAGDAAIPILSHPILAHTLNRQPLEQVVEKYRHHPLESRGKRFTALRREGTAFPTEVMTTALKSICRGLQEINHHLDQFGGPYLLGEFTLPDITIMACFHRLEDVRMTDLLDHDSVPLVSGYWQQLQDRLSYKDAVIAWHDEVNWRTALIEIFGGKKSPNLKEAFSIMETLS